MQVATIKKGDIVIVDGKIETVKYAGEVCVFTEESWARTPSSYDLERVVLLETAEQAQAYRDYMDDAQMYAELSRGM
jgi:hypothetical protein